MEWHGVGYDGLDTQADNAITDHTEQNKIRIEHHTSGRYGMHLGNPRLEDQNMSIKIFSQAWSKSGKGTEIKTAEGEKRYVRLTDHANSEVPTQDKRVSRVDVEPEFDIECA